MAVEGVKYVRPAYASRLGSPRSPVAPFAVRKPIVDAPETRHAEVVAHRRVPAAGQCVAIGGGGQLWPGPSGLAGSGDVASPSVTGQPFHGRRLPGAGRAVRAGAG